ncbi:Metastasis-associated in colon cancer protein 1 SH3 domain-containing protein 7a5 [Collichthys lucidus]|uniref:Metastasis-associated in colon cancer protein 1 SH3 domain-containing protein 7a5 n=1 Tax=Collichthys lucidus TaxID=240159 RepID=A0A4U5V2K9_COLLU|nr:Metastasis-associated in colon cancer protein 1 SH3 domain-containing protein 7a5 [Collichthys lucidus]
MSFRRVGSLMRSKSEGTLIDLDDSVPASDNLNDVKQDNEKHLDRNNDDSSSTSSDEGNVGKFLENKHKVSNRSGRWRSASDILDDLERKVPKRENSFRPPGPVLNPDFEWLKNDREAYKMAWLSHRQLTRSCLDLNLMSQSPGWAQTQATDFQVICKIGHAGGSLLEVVLSNINTKECISLDIKLSGEVKSDPLSQVMTTVVGVMSNKREGPYLKVNDCYIHKNMMQMKLQDLKTHFYVIAVAEASAIQAPATTVWDYLDRQITVAVYGPRGNKNLPPLVLQLWGKHGLKPDKLNNLHVEIGLKDSVFKIKP